MLHQGLPGLRLLLQTAAIAPTAQSARCLAVGAPKGSCSSTMQASGTRQSQDRPSGSYRTDCAGPLRRPSMASWEGKRCAATQADTTSRGITHPVDGAVNRHVMAKRRARRRSSRRGGGASRLLSLLAAMKSMFSASVVSAMEGACVKAIGTDMLIQRHWLKLKCCRPPRSSRKRNVRHR